MVEHDAQVPAKLIAKTKTRATAASGEASIKPRPEAGTRTYDELTEEQRSAAALLHTLLRGMLEGNAAAGRGPSSHSGLEFLPPVDEKRYNRVVLIDGGRGSGKTALLVSLLHAWSSTLRQVSPKDEHFARWSEPRGRLVPVYNLELHPQPESTSLLVHITNQLGRVVDSLEGRQPRAARPATSPWQLGAEEACASRKCWERLQRCVISGWDSNIRQRQAQLDTEAYLLEQQQTVKDQLELSFCFAAFMDALDTDFRAVHGPAESPVLFIITVDDADMNPHRSVELLELLRLLWHPRLAFVLTGESDLFLRTLREHLLGVMLRPLHGISLSAEAAADSGHRVTVSRMARQIYDKIIPPGHRAELPPIAPANRFAHRSVDLSSELKKIGIHKDRPELSLGSYFETDAQLGEVLPERLRGLWDLRQLLQRWHQEQVPAPQAANKVVLRLWQDAVENYLPAGSVTLQAIRERGVTIVENDALCVDLSRVSAGADWREVPRAQWVSEPVKQYVSIHVTIQSLARLDLVLAGGQRLPGPVTAALQLAANVAADQPAGLVLADPSSLTGFEPLLAFADHSAVGLRFAWPLPRRLSFLELAVLCSRWNAVLTHLGVSANEHPSDDMLDRLARSFIRMVILTMQDSRPVVPSEEWPWERLAEQMVLLARSPMGQSTRMLAGWRWAARSVWLLAAPESGLPTKSARKCLSAMEVVANANPAIVDPSEVLQERRRRALIAFGDALTVSDLDSVLQQRGDTKNPTNQRIESVLMAINRTAEGHPWLKYFPKEV